MFVSSAVKGRQLTGDADYRDAARSLDLNLYQQ